MDEESILVEQARAGSEDAFARLVALHQGRVRAWLGRYVRHRDAVDDLAQDVFLAAYRSLDGYKGDAAVSIWLLGIARHRALAWLRDEARLRAREAGTLGTALAGWRLQRLDTEPFDPAGEERRVSALADCVRQLPPHSAALVRDHYYRNLPAVQIARAQGKKESMVRMALLRIRQALRRCVEQKLALEGGR